MFFKKLLLYHAFPLAIACVASSFFINHYRSHNITENYPVSVSAINGQLYIPNFQNNGLASQIALSIALKRSVPVLMGSSELTSHHLSGMATNFFNKNYPKDKFISLGDAGFQCFAMLSVLAANKSLLKGSKIIIILSPGWFEKQYASGTSLNSFFKFCPPNYLYQIYQDQSLNKETRGHIEGYFIRQYDKISEPDAVISLMSKKNETSLHKLFNFPFRSFDVFQIEQQVQSDFDLVSQKQIVAQLSKTIVKPYYFYKRTINWDSLNNAALQEFKTISNNNDLCVQNDYYNVWLRGKRKKKAEAVTLSHNQEYKDFLALIHFLNSVNCKPLFVIMPLNTKAHQNLSNLQPTINSIVQTLQENKFKTLDMFTPNVINYQEGVLEDIMHPYNIGWYQIDKFIIDNYGNGNN